MKNLNNRGSILQIVLVIFLVIIFVITTSLISGFDDEAEES